MSDEKKPLDDDYDDAKGKDFGDDKDGKTDKGGVDPDKGQK